MTGQDTIPSEDQIRIINNPRLSPTGSQESNPTRKPKYPVTGMEVYELHSATFDWLVKSGAYWLRYNGILWSEVESQEGKRNWDVLSELENNLARAAKLNLKVILVVRSTPTWAQEIPGYFCGPVRTSKLDAFGDFMHALVSRYSHPPFSVKFWEIGNEPDIDPDLVSGTSPYGCWGQAEDENYGGSRYAQMLKAIYPRIKSADSDAQVMVGGLLLDCDPVHPPEDRDCRPSNFIEGILESGGADYFDGIGFHAYDYYSYPFSYGNQNWHSSYRTSGPVSAVKARYLKSVLMKYEQEEKFLFNTETGLLCGRSGEEPICQTYEFNMTKANYVVLSNAAGMQEGLLGNIWFSLSGWRGTGLLDINGNALPVMSSFRFASIQLNQADPVRLIQDIPGVAGIEYFRDGKYIWLIWTLEGVPQVIKIENDKAVVHDVWGNIVLGDPYITISTAPIYIEWLN